MTYTTTLSPSGQMTLPAELRKVLGIKVGDRINWKLNKKNATIERARTLEEISADMQARREKLYTEHPDIKARVLANAGMTANEFRASWAKSPAGQAYLSEKYGA